MKRVHITKLSKTTTKHLKRCKDTKMKNKIRTFENLCRQCKMHEIGQNQSAPEAKKNCYLLD